MGIGVEIGIDANAHPEDVARHPQPPAPVLAAEEGQLDTDQRELRLQMGAQDYSNHPLIGEFLLLSIENSKLIFPPLAGRIGGSWSHFSTLKICVSRVDMVSEPMHTPSSTSGWSPGSKLA